MDRATEFSVPAVLAELLDALAIATHPACPEIYDVPPYPHFQIFGRKSFCHCVPEVFFCLVVQSGRGASGALSRCVSKSKSELLLFEGPFEICGNATS